jgi:uncharacterized protein (TIGR03790 family)
MKTTLACVLVLALTGAAWGELAPDEVAVIAMAASGESRRVAEHYVAARGIPESHVLLLAGEPGESVSRAEWEGEMRPAIRNWLAEAGRESKIRCLVTCWDVPLKIGKRDPNSPDMVARKEYLSNARKSYVAQYDGVIKALASLGPGAEPADRPAYDPDTRFEQLTKNFDEAANAFQKRVQAIESEVEKRQLIVAYEKIITAAGGATAVLRWVAGLGDPAQAPQEALRRLDLARGKLQGLQQGLAALAVLPASVARDVQILKLIYQTSGLLGSIRWTDEQLAWLEKNETHASFDSELSLLKWPEYPTFRWIQNFAHYAFDHLPGKWPTLMVSRLAAPNVDLVEKLIDTSIATEQSGLGGKVYLDARGIAYDPNKPKRGSHGEYDQSLRDLAERLREHTDLEVVVNDEDGLFQPGECPDAALYCGWYSLAEYVDAFDWRPGAVGYHIASSEAARLRQPGAKVWCSAMLEDGVSATLGPVAEPYLVSFPLPDDFFSLLLTGRYSLVETYYLTNPFNSWQMILIGDPLYNPFKNRPLLDEDDLPDRLKARNP